MEIEIMKAIKLLRENGYAVKKVTENMKKDAGECDGKECIECSCNMCIVH